MTDHLIDRVFTVQAQLIVTAPEAATAQAYVEDAVATVVEGLAASPVALQVEKEGGMYVFQES